MTRLSFLKNNIKRYGGHIHYACMCLSLFCFLAFAAFPVSTLASKAHGLTVIVSIKPLELIIKDIIGHRGKVHLLIPPVHSPHSFALTPTAMKMLVNSDIVIAVGGGLEGELEHVIKHARSDKDIVYLIHHTELVGTEEKQHLHDQHHDHHDHHHHRQGHAGIHSQKDLHIWLDPVIMKHLVKVIADMFIQRDPDYTKHYQNNAKRLIQQIESIDSLFSEHITKLQKMNYVVAHDALRYLETRYDFAPLGILHAQHGIGAGLQNLQAIASSIEYIKDDQQEEVCLFYDTPEPPALALNLKETYQLKLIFMDILGVALTANDDGYPALMQNILARMQECH